MKKEHSKKLFISTFISLFYILLLTGCKNFLTGENLSSKITNMIEYKNSPYMSVSIEANNNSYKSMSPLPSLYEDKYKVTDTIELNFEKNPDCTFFGWEAEPKNIITFENEDSENTKAQITKYTNEKITIRALCFKPEKTPPVFENCYLARSENYLKDESGQIITKKSAIPDINVRIMSTDSESDNYVDRNHIGYNFYLNTTFYDTDSDINDLKINVFYSDFSNSDSFLTKYKSNENLTDATTFEKTYTRNDFKKVSINKYIFDDVIELNLKKEGLVYITLTITDFFGNQTEKKFHVYYDTGDTLKFIISNNLFQKDNVVTKINRYALETKDSIIEYINNKQREILIYGYDQNDAPFIELYEYTNIINTTNNITLKYSYKTDKGKTIEGDIGGDKSNNLLKFKNLNQKEGYIKTRLFEMETESEYNFNPVNYTDEEGNILKDEKNNALSNKNEYFIPGFKIDADDIEDLSGKSFEIIVTSDDLFTNKYIFTFPEKAVCYLNTSYLNTKGEISILKTDYQNLFLITGDNYAFATDNLSEIKLETNENQEIIFSPYKDEYRNTIIQNPNYYIFNYLHSDGFIDQVYLTSPISDKIEVNTKEPPEGILPKMNIIKTEGVLNNGLFAFTVKLNDDIWNDFDYVYITAEKKVNGSFTEPIYQNDLIIYKHEISRNIQNFELQLNQFSFFKNDFEAIRFTIYGEKYGETIKGNDLTYTKEDLYNILEDVFPPEFIKSQELNTYQVLDTYGEYFSQKFTDYKVDNNLLNKCTSGINISKTVYQLNNKDFNNFKITNNEDGTESFDYKDCTYNFECSLFDLKDNHYSQTLIIYDNLGNIGNCNFAYDFIILTLPKVSILSDNTNKYVQFDEKLVENIKGNNLAFNQFGKKLDSMENNRFLLNCFEWDNDYNNWTEKDSGLKVQNNQNNYIKFNNLPQNSFIKYNIIFDTKYLADNEINSVKSDWQYFYTGTVSNPVKKLCSYNSQAIYVSSNYPVFVQTLITDKDYETCKNWPYDYNTQDMGNEYSIDNGVDDEGNPIDSWTALKTPNWNNRHKSVNDMVYDFSNTNQSTQIYIFNQFDIPEGYCYVGVIHYADGTVKMTDVYQN